MLTILGKKPIYMTLYLQPYYIWKQLFNRLNTLYSARIQLNTEMNSSFMTFLAIVVFLLFCHSKSMWLCWVLIGFRHDFLSDHDWDFLNRFSQLYKALVTMLLFAQVCCPMFNIIFPIIHYFIPLFVLALCRSRKWTPSVQCVRCSGTQCHNSAGSLMLAKLDNRSSRPRAQKADSHHWTPFSMGQLLHSHNCVHFCKHDTDE